jgi:hypothetical protein
MFATNLPTCSNTTGTEWANVTVSRRSLYIRDKNVIPFARPHPPPFIPIYHPVGFRNSNSYSNAIVVVAVVAAVANVLRLNLQWESLCFLPASVETMITWFSWVDCRWAENGEYFLWRNVIIYVAFNRLFFVFYTSRILRAYFIIRSKLRVVVRKLIPYWIYSYPTGLINFMFLFVFFFFFYYYYYYYSIAPSFYND